PESITTGAANDIERATGIARNMVTKWGLSDKLGPLVYGAEEGEIFLGRSITAHKEISDNTAAEIDHEIRAIIDRNYKKAETIIKEHIAQFEALAEALIKYETIDKKQITAIMDGRRIRLIKPDGGHKKKTPSAGGDNKGHIVEEKLSQEILPEDSQTVEKIEE
ncbi:MAG TPA: hypothetical protein DEG23_00260, partial [Coxiellaceae bacterium]|nr:hypothetical protein [Coxiellaceae bacterium]HBY55234.1 hypothetical protein [Coxiellaceae bacterium]